MRQVMLLAVVLSIVLQSRPVIDAQSQPSRSTESIKEEVVVATRVLFDSGFLDTAGHVSVRLDANRFLMPWRRAPELVVADDLMEYDLDGRARRTAACNGRQGTHVHQAEPRGWWWR
jgi:hypothetical protein